MKGRQKTALYPLIWIFVGVIMVAVGLLLHNGLGWLFLFVGLLVTLATLYVWSTLAMWRTHQSLSQAKPSKGNKIEEAFELAPLSGVPPN